METEMIVMLCVQFHSFKRDRIMKIFMEKTVTWLQFEIKIQHENLITMSCSILTISNYMCPDT